MSKGQMDVMKVVYVYICICIQMYISIINIVYSKRIDNQTGRIALVYIGIALVAFLGEKLHINL